MFTPTSDPPPDGDFDGDGDVDGADFLAFQQGFGESGGATLSQGDADHNGAVDGADLTIWEANYGTQSPLAVPLAASVPEPNSVALVLFSVALAALCYKRKS